MKFGYRLWGYLLPFPMWLAESFMRTVMQDANVYEFFPPSLAAVALGLVIPALSPNIKSAELNRKSGIKSNRSELVRWVAAQVLFLGTLGWLLTIYLSIGGNWPANWPWANSDQKFWIAGTLYTVAIVLNEWKERMK